MRPDRGSGGQLWNWTHNPGMCPDGGLNLQPFGVQNNAPTNWATQPGRHKLFLKEEGRKTRQKASSPLAWLTWQQPSVLWQRHLFLGPLDPTFGIPQAPQIYPEKVHLGVCVLLPWRPAGGGEADGRNCGEWSYTVHLPGPNIRHSPPPTPKRLSEMSKSSYI